MPERIQLRRTKGWRMPEGAVSVARPTRWGNPFALDIYRIDYPESDVPVRRRMAISDFRGLVDGRWPEEADYPTVEEIRSDLRGKDLACWCPLEDENGNRVPCHADVLLEVANAPR